MGTASQGVLVDNIGIPSDLIAFHVIIESFGALVSK